MPNINDAPGFTPPLLGGNFVTYASASQTANPGDLSQGGWVQNTAATPGTLTPRTAAQMIADSNLSIGQTWFIYLNNDQGTGAWTLGTASGVTVSGTATAGTNTVTVFQGKVTAANTIVFTRICTIITAA